MSIFSISLDKITGSSLKSGDFLFIKVLKKINSDNFIIKIGNRSRIIRSRVQLEVGKEYRVRLEEKKGIPTLRVIKDTKSLLQEGAAVKEAAEKSTYRLFSNLEKLHPKIDDSFTRELEQRLFHEEYVSEWKPLEEEKNPRWFKSEEDYWFLQPLLVIKDRTEQKGWLRMFLSGDKKTFRIYLHLEDQKLLWEFTLEKKNGKTTLIGAVNKELWAKNPPEKWIQWAEYWEKKDIIVDRKLKLLKNQGTATENKRDGFSFITDIRV